jgi:cell division protein FtsW
VWAIQLFLSGVPFLWVLVMIIMCMGGVFGAYHVFPHVAKRINNFLDPAEGDNYQIARSLEAFRNGGILGRGPGEGEVKQFLPDSHTDFIFAVAGEEFGVIACMLILGLFAFIVLRGLTRVREENDLFVVLAVAGVLVQFGIQSVINMGVAVNLFPAKGMTLPFLSYGGSSVVAIALGMGMMLALTRRRFGQK